MKKIFLFSLVCLSFLSFGQKDLFPMKGSYIYYVFTEETENTKHCIKHYSSMIDSTGSHNSSATELMTNIAKKMRNLSEIELTFGGIKSTQVMFTSQPSMSMEYSCTGEVKTPSGFFITLPTQTQIIPNILLYQIFTNGKFKVTSQMITATVKINFISNNKYELIFTNFKITYTGSKGSKVITEEINLEDIYHKLQEEGKDDERMFNKSLDSLKTLDTIVKACAKIYSEELHRTYEIDEL